MRMKIHSRNSTTLCMYIIKIITRSAPRKYISSNEYNLLAFRLEGGVIPARAHSNREWQSNKIECSNSDLVPKTGLNFARKQLYARSDVRQCLGRGLPPYLSLLKKKISPAHTVSAVVVFYST